MSGPRHLRRPQVTGIVRDQGCSLGSATRDRAILALLSERSITAAARRAGLAERTLRRWLQEDGFAHDLAEARRATFNAGVQRLQALFGRAVDALEDLLGAKRYPAVRLGAARLVVELAVNRHDAEEITRRLEKLENQSSAIAKANR